MPYAKTKLQRDINAQTPLRFRFHLKNIRINQRIVGCAGFVENTDNGKIMYVSTEKSPVSNKNTYRKASHLTDFTEDGHTFISDEGLPQAIINLLN